MTLIDVKDRSHIVQLLCERAVLHPDRIALRFIADGESEGTTLSYGELHLRASALAAQLAANAPAGERALLLFPSGPHYVIALLACFYAGIVAVPAYPPQSPHPRHVARIAAIARDATPRLVLTESTLGSSLSALHSQVAELRAVPVLELDTLGSLPAHDGPVGSLRSAGLALLQYTSGSTATPKGVMLTHANLMANEAAIHDAFSIRADDVIVSWLPLFHDMGLIGALLQPLYAGVSGVLMAPQRFLERPRRWLDAISRWGGTVSGGPDFAYRLCTERVALNADNAESKLDLSSWRLAFCGAEPVRQQTLRAFAEKFEPAGLAREALYPCYGLAESTLLVSGGQRGAGMRSTTFDSAELKSHRAVPAAGSEGQALVSCGAARPAHRVEIVDPETGRAVAEGNVGEIHVAGPSVARGYWHNAEATDDTFVQRDAAVFLRTGDLGFLLEGELFVTGRVKDMIIVRGQNLYPQDIEREIEHDNAAVRVGRVVAFPIEHAGEERIAIAAEINPRLKKLIDPEKMCSELSERVTRAHAAPPALVLLLNPGAVLVTSSGKLRRGACLQAWQAGELSIFAQSGPAAVSSAAL